jgi:hypothetical protein
MDFLTFTSKLVDSLAWPICTLVIALAFRTQIRDLLSRITKGKVAGGEFEFSPVAKGVLAVAAVPQATTPETEDDDHERGPDASETYSLDEAYELVDAAPQYAVIAGWRVLNRAALDALSAYDESSGSDDYPSKNPPPARVAGYLRDQRVLSPDQLALFDELRQIRNSAVHLDDFKIDENKAKEYLILAELLISKLEKHSR